MSKSIIVPFFRSAYNYDRDLASNEAGLRCADVSLTQQQFKDDCDINILVERFGIAEVAARNVRAPVFADFHGVFDFQTAMNAVVAARESFLQMAPRVRARFHNDPAEFVEFCSDEANAAEMERFGLAVAKPVVAPAIAPSAAVAPVAPVSAPVDEPA